MLKPIWGETNRQAGPTKRRRRRRLRTIAMLPTLLTLGNLYFGFAAAYCCGREMEDVGRGALATENRTLNSVFLEKRAPSYLSIAVWMLIGAMICDALDGRVARKTGQSSRFGEQLDSLADVVSFGVAPALMMVTLTRREFPPPDFGRFGQLAVFIGIIYVWCAALRLARFNVEATVKEATHRGFRGLPSPGAAAAVISIIFVHDHLKISGQWVGTIAVLARILPVCALMIALLMVSRLPYAHAVSTLLRRRPFSHVVPMLLAIPFIWIYTEEVALLAAWAFALSGPVRYLWYKIRGRPVHAEPASEDQHEPASPEMRQQAP